jgi:NTE family protein
MKKKALCLPGGGSKGSFQVGVLEYLIKVRGESYDIITGTSVGALNGAYLAQYKKEDLHKGIDNLKKLWLSISNRDIKRHWIPFGYAHALWKKSLYNTKPLRTLIEENLDTDKLKASGVKLKISTINLDSGDHVKFSGDHPNIKEAVMASSAFPAFFEPIEINGDIYWDGGIKEVAPLLPAIEMGAEDITIINTGTLKSKRIDAKSKKTLSLSLRAMSLEGDEIVRNDLQHFIETNQRLSNRTLVCPSKRIINYTYFEPSKTVITFPLDFDPDEIKEMIELGYKTAKEHFEKN